MIEETLLETSIAEDIVADFEAKVIAQAKDESEKASLIMTKETAVSLAADYRLYMSSCGLTFGDTEERDLINWILSATAESEGVTLATDAEYQAQKGFELPNAGRDGLSDTTKIGLAIATAGAVGLAVMELLK